MTPRGVTTPGHRFYIYVPIVSQQMEYQEDRIRTSTLRRILIKYKLYPPDLKEPSAPGDHNIRPTSNF
jgi:hypothetical protein